MLLYLLNLTNFLIIYSSINASSHAKIKLCCAVTLKKLQSSHLLLIKIQTKALLSHYIVQQSQSLKHQRCSLVRSSTLCNLHQMLPSILNFTAQITDRLQLFFCCNYLMLQKLNFSATLLVRLFQIHRLKPVQYRYPHFF